MYIIDFIKIWLLLGVLCKWDSNDMLYIRTDAMDFRTKPY